MFLLRDNNSTKDDRIPAFQRCSLPELYASIENFRKDRRKSMLLKTHGISLKEAQKMLTKNLNPMSLVSRTIVDKEESQPIFTCTVVKKEDEKPESMAELLQRSLLINSLSPLEELSRSQKRLAQSGIPPPIHTFPYNIMDDHPSSFPGVTDKKIQSIKLLDSPDPTQDKLIYQHRVPRHCSPDSGEATWEKNK